MRKGDDARRELLSCAAELFDGRGYDAVSIKDITDALGWPKSLFYYYYRSKEELVAKAAEVRADEIVDLITARVNALEDGYVSNLSCMLGCMGFWYTSDPLKAAGLITTLYSAGSLPWRVYLRSAIMHRVKDICNNIISDGVKDYEMYTPYPHVMGSAALELTADLAEKLAPLVADGGEEAFDSIAALLKAYRCALERLVEAPFGSLRVVEMAFLRDVSHAMGANGGSNDEKVVCGDCYADRHGHIDSGNG